MGDRPPRRARRRHPRLRVGAALRARTSRSRRSARAAIMRDENFAERRLLRDRPAPGRRPCDRSHGSHTSPTSRRSRSRRSSGGAQRRAHAPGRLRGRALPRPPGSIVPASGSTPTPTSISRASWTSSSRSTTDARATLAGAATRFLVVSFDSDWRFPTSHSPADRRRAGASGCRRRAPRDRVAARSRLLPAAGARVSPSGQRLPRSGGLLGRGRGLRSRRLSLNEVTAPMRLRPARRGAA